MRDSLHLTPGALGLVLLAMSVGSVSALPMAGGVVLRLGPARTVAGSALVFCAGLGLVAAAGSASVVAAGLLLMGLSNGMWDVAMNVEGADVERALGRAIMPRFHGAWSLGTVGGAMLGAVAARAGIPVRWHLAVVAVLVVVAAWLATRRFLTVGHAAPARPVGGTRRAALAAWRDRRTLVVGLLVLGFAFLEGSANDWLGLALVDGYRVSNAAGAFGFGVFVTAMTVMRMVGTRLLDRYGRAAVLRVSVGIVALGLLAVITEVSVPVAFCGAALWGLGTALGFPVGMSAAADDPRGAAARVAVVASIGYTAFLAGPPLIGLLANQIGTTRALVAAFVAAVLALVTCGAARPVETGRSAPSGDVASEG